MICPFGLSLVTYASWHGSPWQSRPRILGCSVPAVVGKFSEPVLPVTYALPERSSAMLFTMSTSAPPRNVIHSTDCPPGASLATNPSASPLKGRRVGGFVANCDDSVNPATYVLPAASTSTSVASSQNFP